MAFTRPRAAQIDFDVTNISDPLLRLNSGQSGSADKDVGIVIERGSDTNVALIYDESADEFVLVNTTEDGTTSGNVTISSYADLQVGTINTATLEIGGTAVTSTATELNLLDGVTGTLVTEAGTQTLTNKTLTSPTISDPTLTGTFAFTSDATSTPAMTLTANSISDGVGTLRINGAQADIFLNPATATHTTVTFAVNDDQRLAFGMDNNSDFYITRRTSSTWYDDTFVLDRDTGLLSLGYGATVAGGDFTINDADYQIIHGDTAYNQKQYVLYGTTTNATETEIFVGGTASSRIPVASNTTVFYEVDIVARRTDATGESGGWHLKAVADNFSGTVADVGTVYEVQVATDDANYAVDARADNTNDSIGIYVTGVAAKTIRWTAIVRTFEVAQ